MPLPDIAPAMVSAQFEGWFTDADLADPFEPPFAPGPGQTTLYSAWSQDEYAISYDLDGGTNSSDNPDTLTNDTTTVTLRDPSKEGYAFEGWYADSSFSQPVTILPRGATSDQSLSAKWRLIEYPLFYAAGIGTNPASNPHSYTVLDDDLAIAPPTFETATPNTGTWYADPFFAQKAATVIPAGSTGDKVFYAYGGESGGSGTGPGSPVLAKTGDGLAGLAQLAVFGLFAFGCTMGVAAVQEYRRCKNKPTDR